MTLDQAVAIFEKADRQLGFGERRYPAVVDWLAGVVAVADENGDNGSSLAMYRESEFIAWMMEAKMGVAMGKYKSLCEAVNETRYELEAGGSH